MSWKDPLNKRAKRCPICGRYRKNDCCIYNQDTHEILIRLHTALESIEKQLNDGSWGKGFADFVERLYR